MKNKIITIFLITFTLASCAPVAKVVPTPAETTLPTSTFTTIPPTPTITPTFTPNATSTLKPTATATPAPRILQPVRPVDSAVPLYHKFGQVLSGMNIPRYGNKHQGYDYGFNNCNPITFDVIAIEAGEVMQLGEEWDVWLDHGDVQLTNGEVWRVMSAYAHTKYDSSLKVGQKIEKGQVIAHFVDCNTLHPEGRKTDPELELTMRLADARATKRLKGKDLMSYMVEKQFNILGNFTTFDPILIGLSPE